MDPDLIELYNQEALYMRELMDEFGDAHRKIGRRLGMSASTIADPYVNRLLQTFSFASARMQARMAADFPQLTGDLLETVFPNYVSPTPAMAVARLFPDGAEGDLTGGFLVKRGSTFRSRIPEGEKSACIYRSSQDVTLYPLEIIDARLTGVPPDIPSMSRWLPVADTVKGALRLRLRTTNGANVSGLDGLDRLPIYLAGDEPNASHLFELLHVAGLATVTASPEQFGAPDAPLHVVNRGAVVHEAMKPEQGVLPLRAAKFHGQSLLQEYCACASRFYFFTLTGLRDGLKRVDGREVEIVVLLNRSVGELANRISVKDLALFCTPVINLFKLRIDSAELAPNGGEICLQPRPMYPWDYEVFSVDKLFGHVEADSERTEFMPRHHALNLDEGDHGRYFAVRRARRFRPNLTRRYGTRTSHTMTEFYVSLVDGNGLPYPNRLSYLSADIWVTNGDLPNLLEYSGHDDLDPMHSMPVNAVGLVRAPSVPRAALAEKEIAWKLIRQIGFGHGLLNDAAGIPSSEALRDMLRLFLQRDDVKLHAQFDAIRALRMKAVTRRMPPATNMTLGRGIAVRLDIDEAGFDGISPYLLGLVLEHVFARRVSMHSFVQTEMHSPQRGRIARWPMRTGARSVL